MHYANAVNTLKPTPASFVSGKLARALRSLCTAHKPPGSPSGASTLITSAPSSASCITANGPARTWLKSSIRTPEKAWLEVGIAAINQERIARVPVTCGAHDVACNSRKILRYAPSAHGNPWHNVIGEFFPCEGLLCHSCFYPTGQQSMGGDPVSGVFDCESFNHRYQCALCRGVVFSLCLTGYDCKTRCCN